VREGALDDARGAREKIGDELLQLLVGDHRHQVSALVQILDVHFGAGRR
jgi:hypothetical protein